MTPRKLATALVLVAVLAVLPACGIIGTDNRTTSEQVGSWFDVGGRDASSKLFSDYLTVKTAINAPDGGTSLYAACQQMRTDVLVAGALDQDHPLPGDLGKKWDSALLHMSAFDSACLNGDGNTAGKEFAAIDMLQLQADLTTRYLGTN